MLSFEKAAILTIVYGADIMLIFLKLVDKFPYSWWWITGLTFFIPVFMVCYAIYRSLVFRIWGRRNLNK